MYGRAIEGPTTPTVTYGQVPDPVAVDVAVSRRGEAEAEAAEVGAQRAGHDHLR